MYSRQTADLVTPRSTRGLPAILTVIVILVIAALALGAVAVMSTRATTIQSTTKTPFVPVTIQAGKAAAAGDTWATLRKEHLGAAAAPAFVPQTIQADQGTAPSSVHATTRSPHSVMLGKRPRHGDDVSGPSSYSGAARRAADQVHLNGAGN